MEKKKYITRHFSMVDAPTRTIHIKDFIEIKKKYSTDQYVLDTIGKYCLCLNYMITESQI